ncbi:hypothetical protein [Arthrobacter psychrolactophilus]
MTCSEIDASRSSSSVFGAPGKVQPAKLASINGNTTTQIGRRMRTLVMTISVHYHRGRIRELEAMGSTPTLA